MAQKESKAASTVTLPKPKFQSAVSVEEALQKRRSVREFKKEPLTLSDVSQLLWAAGGMVSPVGFRSVPSAGALYPLEFYLVAGNVTGLPQGVYKYRLERHELAKISDGDHRKELYAASLHQESLQQAAAIVVISAIYQRTTVKYGERGVRYIHMEAGHASQNVYLQCVSLHLGTVAIGAFDDESVRRTVGMPDTEMPLYLMPIGKM